MKKEIIIGLTSWCLMGCGSEAGVTDFNDPGNKTNVRHGESAEHHQVSYTVGLTNGLDGTLAYCSGILMGDDWGITAGHCTTSMKPRYAAYGSPDVNIKDVDCLTKLAGVAAHENFNRDGYKVDKNCNLLDSDGQVVLDPEGRVFTKGYNTNDIGVFVLQEPISPAVFGEILPTADYDKEIPVGEYVELCGLGRTEEDEVGKLYCGLVPVRVHHERDIVFSENFPDGENDQPGTATDACHGDSGSGTHTVDSQKIIAVTSRLPKEAPQVRCGYGYVGPGVGHYFEDGSIYETRETAWENAVFDDDDSWKEEGDGVCMSDIPEQADPEKENPLMGDPLNCSYSGNYSGNTNSIPWGLLTLLAVPVMRRRRN